MTLIPIVYKVSFKDPPAEPEENWVVLFRHNYYSGKYITPEKEGPKPSDLFKKSQ